MRAVLQRVSRASVSVAGEVVGAIDAGLLALIGVAMGDTSADARAMAAKTAGLRIFTDEDGKMNRSVSETGGSILVVSQFTLVAESRRGRRPSFAGAADPFDAEALLESFTAELRSVGLEVAEGSFGAHMSVELVNDGPVTIVLESRDGRIVR